MCMVFHINIWGQLLVPYDKGSLEMAGDYGRIWKETKVWLIRIPKVTTLLPVNGIPSGLRSLFSHFNRYVLTSFCLDYGSFLFLTFSTELSMFHRFRVVQQPICQLCPDKRAYSLHDSDTMSLIISCRFCLTDTFIRSISQGDHKSLLLWAPAQMMLKGPVSWILSHVLLRKRVQLLWYIHGCQLVILYKDINMYLLHQLKEKEY